MHIVIWSREYKNLFHNSERIEIGNEKMYQTFPHIIHWKSYRVNFQNSNANLNCIGTQLSFIHICPYFLYDKVWSIYNIICYFVRWSTLSIEKMCIHDLALYLWVAFTFIRYHDGRDFFTWLSCIFCTSCIL